MQTEIRNNKLCVLVDKKTKQKMSFCQLVGRIEVKKKNMFGVIEI